MEDETTTKTTMTLNDNQTQTAFLSNIQNNGKQGSPLVFNTSHGLQQKKPM